MLRYAIYFSLSLALAGNLAAQPGVHQQSIEYEWPEDPLVKEKLDKWQDLKFGMIIHWGLYAVPGIVESWQLCSEDWVGRDSAILTTHLKGGIGA
jgi:alpha-L-fucosidase